MDELTLFWLSGEAQVIPMEDTGNRLSDAADAMNAAGIGLGALQALDFFHEGDVRHLYKWNAEERRWDSAFNTPLDEWGEDE